MQKPKLVPELLCSNLKQSLNFYVTMLGFSVMYERLEEGFSYLDLDGAQLMLEEAEAEDMDSGIWWTGRAEKPYGRGINFQIEVDNADEIAYRLGQSDWPMFLPLEEKWYRKDSHEVGQRQFLVQDPDGYLLRLFTSLGKRPL